MKKIPLTLEEAKREQKSALEKCFALLNEQKQAIDDYSAGKKIVKNGGDYEKVSFEMPALRNRRNS